LLGGLLALGTSTGICVSTIFVLRSGRTQLLELLLWIIFLFWQLFPLVFEGFSPGMNFREVARYPVSLRLFVMLNVAYGLFDPAALAGLLWLLSIWIGILIERPQLAIPAAFLFLVFAALNVVCNRIVMGVFERLQSTRKGREGLVAILLVLTIVPQMFNLIVNGVVNVRGFHLPAWTHGIILGLLHVSPPGLVVESLQPARSSVLLTLGLLAGYLTLAILLQVRQLRATYMGEIYAETFKTNVDLKIKPGWKLPGLSESVSAIVEKELRYIRLNSRLLVSFAYPLILFVFVLLGKPAKGMAFSGWGGTGILGAFAALMATAVSNMSYNTFGMDREAFGRWLLFPLSLNKILVAKSIAQGFVITFVYCVGAAAVLFFRHVPWNMFVAITAGFLALVIIHLGAGTVISVFWPKRVEVAQMKSRMTSSAAGLASLLIMLPTGAVIALVVLGTWSLQLGWLPLVAAVLGLVFSIQIYRWLSAWAVRHAEAHLEEIASQLGV
jgi:hypothetical protein